MNVISTTDAVLGFGNAMVNPPNVGTASHNGKGRQKGDAGFESFVHESIGKFSKKIQITAKSCQLFHNSSTK